MEKYVIYSIIQWLYQHKKGDKFVGKGIDSLFFDGEGRDLCGFVEVQVEE
jgi:hypothetical protein